MKTCYDGHDHSYRVKRARGDTGWDHPAVCLANFHRIQGFFPKAMNFSYRVLDLGCGSGELTHHYATLAGDVVGIDISPTAIAWAREKYPCIEFICESVLTSDALPMQHFDLAIDSNCFHCIIGNDRGRFLSNVFGWLRNGGFLILHTMCNEPVGRLLHGYNGNDRIIYQRDIATRYLGRDEDILSEVGAAEFLCLRHTIVRQTDGPDILLSLHQKTPISRLAIQSAGR